MKTLFALLLGLTALAQAAPAATSAFTAGAPATRCSVDALLDAIRIVESGGQRNGGRDANGDGGRAIGPYQIHRRYFIDAGVAGRYDDCRDPDYARRVVIAYWKRWCPEALARGDAEVLARVHNGGPQGAGKASTLAFWHKVERALPAASARSPQAGR